MIRDGNKGSLKGDCFARPESNQQLNFDNLCPKIEAEKGVMETDLCRNTSEELFLKAMMETSIGMPAPTMEMLGFKNISQSFRVDSEELFKSWLTNGENHGHNSSGKAHRTRQASKRISTELPGLTGQQHGSTLQKKPSADLLNTQSSPTNDSISSDLNQQSLRNAVERSMQASNLYLAKAWFHSSQPMTRSRSSELRKRYAAMQGAQTNAGFQASLNVSSLGILKEDLAASTGLNDLPMHDMNNELGSFMSPSNSSSSTFNNLQMGNVDKISSVVNMLKGTLERKKLSNQNKKEAVDDSSNILYPGYDIAINSSFDEGNSTHDISGTFHELSPGEVKDPGALHSVQETFQLSFGGFVNLINPIQTNMYSREPSQSESSAGAPVVSSGLEACDGPTSSSQNLGFCDSSRKRAVNSTHSEPGSRSKDFRERLIDNLKDDRKKGFIRYGSVNSTSSVDKGDPTKKRRVERSRKMAEAKERNSQPAIPSDMQSVLKRCENFEKEVRSLKLNLSFMNRKDSEQTKKIEELQKQNEDLADEKERLLEEIERILSETGRM